MPEAPVADTGLEPQELADLAALRRDIHAHPELGFEENRTADLVAWQLQRWDVEVHRGLAGTGVIGLVHGRDGGRCGRSVGLRADLDALPMTERNTFAHASRSAGRMHACGHDGHTAMLLGAARVLARRRDFDGTAVLIFQPAEEGRGGAQTMLAEGLFDRYPVEAVFGLHNWPGLPEGTLACSPGPVMASANVFHLVVHGQGSHAALPHAGVDPVMVAAQIVTAWQTIVSRNLRPIDAAVLSTTILQAGEATNVIPDRAELQGTVRTYRDEVTDRIEQRMAALAQELCRAHGARADFRFERKAPAVVNHAEEARFAAAVMRELVGPGRTLEQEPQLPSEDFAYMLQAKAGAYAFIGNGDGAHRAAAHGGGPCTLHNPSYDFNDALLPVGVAYWARLAQRWLSLPRPA